MLYLNSELSYKYLISLLITLGLAACSDNGTNIVEENHLNEEKSPPIENYYPVPSKSQLSWQDSEMGMFIHFGINTFTDKEWGDGTEDPAIFNPSNCRTMG